MMQKSNKKPLSKTAKVELVIATILIIGLTVVTITDFSIVNITGFAQLDIYSQELNIPVSHDVTYELQSISETPFTISSLRFSGDITGDGRVEISLANSNEELLAYSNIRKDSKGLTSITGYNAKDADDASDGAWLTLSPVQHQNSGWLRTVSEGEETTSGMFSHSCADTCFTTIQLPSEDTPKLIFKVDPGTELKLTGIVYTIMTE